MSGTPDPPDPNAPPDARLQQAMTLFRSRKPAEAAALCRRVLAERPGDAHASLVLATIARQTGGAPESVRILREAIERNPDHPALEPELAASLVVANRAHEALPILERLTADRPDAPLPHYWLGQAYLRLWKPAEGIRALERARDLDPNNPETLFALGAACISAGRPAAAEPHLRAFLEKRPASIPGMHSLATSLDYQNRPDEAESLYRQILAKAPAYPAALTGLARQLHARARRDEALALLEPHATSTQTRPDASLAALFAELALAAGREPDARDAVTRALAGPPLPAQPECTLRFALAKVEDAAGNHDAAFDQYRRANELFPRTFNAQARRRFTAEMIDTFTRETLASLPRAATRSDCAPDRPVIVCGMPRSGTTLVEQIIAAHPDAAGVGELAHLRATYNELAADLPGRPPACLAAVTAEQLSAAADRYLDAIDALAPGAARIVDKMPANFEILGLIELLLPGARVIHCTRSPLDTCLSCFTTQLSPAHDYAHRLEDLALAYAEYRRLTAHWRGVLSLPLLEVNYEELVADTEAVARKLIDFLGLPWNDACLRFHESTTTIATASVDQVRRPIYASSVGRWKRYESHIAPLREALRAAGVEG